MSSSEPSSRFRNPVLPGTYPDPSVCRVGDDYYLVTSTFEYFPGLPIFHSTDLQNWEQVGHAFDRADQLDLAGVPSSGGLYAPTIRYHGAEGGGTWYIVCTLVDPTVNANGDTGVSAARTRRGNFILTATDPRGPWSDPIWLPDAPGIDPSLFFDDDGRLWCCGTRLADEPEWHDQTTVWLRELDPATFDFIGETFDLWHGALIGAVWAEGPHIYRRGDWYYLLASEGGTEFNHALSVARSRSITGPYEGYAANPVFTHRHLGHAAPISNVGHADLVETADGSWAAVLLATRPYGGFHANLGRETFAVEVEWQNDWPVFAPGEWMLRAAPAVAGEAAMPKLLEWTQLRTSATGFARIDEAAATVALTARPVALTETGTPSFVGVRQRHMDATFRATLHQTSALAGIVVRQSEAAHVTLAVEAGEARLTRVEGGVAEVVGETAVHGSVALEVVARGQDYTFWVTDRGCRREAGAVDGRFLSSQSAGGFVGVWFGLFAEGEGAVALFDAVAYSAD